MATGQMVKRKDQKVPDGENSIGTKTCSWRKKTHKTEDEQEQNWGLNNNSVIFYENSHQNIFLLILERTQHTYT